MPPRRIRVLVEGGDDAHFFHHLFQKKLQAGLKLGEDILSFNGIEGLLQKSSVIGKETGYDAVVIICDADIDPAKRWEGLRSSLLNDAGESFLPEGPDEGGTRVAFVRDTQLALWMMPDNRSAGALEDFLWKISNDVAPQASLKRKAGLALAGLTKDERLFSDADGLKAELRTWLAWQKEPGAPYGLAVNMECFDLDHPSCSQFLGWFQRLLVSEII